MGYVRQRKIYRLRFEDPDMNGLIVRARSVPMGELLAIGTAAADFENGSRDPQGLGQMFEVFASALVEWNLEEPDGTPVPTTVDGLYAQDIDFLMEIIQAWIEAIQGVAGPLGQPSPSGGPSLAATIPMETKSPSRAS